MINYLVKKMIKRLVPEVPIKQRNAEDIIYKSKEGIAATLALTQDDIVDSLYYEAKDLFNSSIKSSQLNREQILYIKYSLREFLKDYREYYPNHYTNDAHEIYTLLKSPFLNNENYSSVIATIKYFTH
jgi:hypothetical protein